MTPKTPIMAMTRIAGFRYFVEKTDKKRDKKGTKKYFIMPLFISGGVFWCASQLYDITASLFGTSRASCYYKIILRKIKKKTWRKKERKRKYLCLRVNRNHASIVLDRGPAGLTGSPGVALVRSPDLVAALRAKRHSLAVCSLPHSSMLCKQAPCRGRIAGHIKKKRRHI